MPNKENFNNKKINQNQHDKPQENNCLTLDVSGFTEKFLTDYESLEDFKEKSGFFYKYYITENDIKSEKNNQDSTYIDDSDLSIANESITSYKPFRNISKQKLQNMEKLKFREAIISTLDKIYFSDDGSEYFYNKQDAKQYLIDVIESYVKDKRRNSIKFNVEGFTNAKN